MTGRATVGIALLVTLLTAQAASGHALLRQSEPSDGAVLQRAPDHIVITFTEAPEPALSVIKVVDSTGLEVNAGPVQTVPGQPLELQVPLAALPQGIYTVTWRTVSRADGHVTGGAFAFGVGIAPAGATPQPAPLSPSILDVVARWIFYVGVSVMIGAAWVYGLAFPRGPAGGMRVLSWGWLISILGLTALAESQRADASATFTQLFSTAVGRALGLRVGAILLAGAAIALVHRVPQQRQRAVVLAVVGCAFAAILVHVIAGHAGASIGPWRWAKIAIQWAHMSATAVWLGGLAALLIGLRGSPRDAAATAVRRFSAVAGVALGTVIVTGAARAIDEVGAWTLLTTTEFGRLVIVKSTLLLALAALGAVNRYRNVPAVPRSFPGIRKVGITELAIATAVFATTGLLTSLAPANLLDAASRPAPLVVEGSDFGPTVRARLEVTPGTPGINGFTFRITDYDTGQPIAAQRVSLRFSPLDRPGIEASTLVLTASADGMFSGRGSNLSIAGRWQITATIERGVSSVELPLTLTLRSPPAEVATMRLAGQPTLYTVKLPAAMLQIYFEPEPPGPTTVHLTFFDSKGNELPIAELPTVTSTAQGGVTTPLRIRRFGLGHFLAEGALPRGELLLQITAPLAGGQILDTSVPIRP